MRIIALVTEDFSLYYDLVKKLKGGDVTFISIPVGERIPWNVGVVLTSEGESSRISFPNKIAVPDDADLDAVINEAKRMLTGTDLYSMVVVGVDPGPRPGIAVLGDGEVVYTEQVCIPEEAAARIKAIHKLYPAKEFVVRVGHGDPTKRNRIINSLASLNVPIEIVDEKGTSDHIEAPDIHAAINIARETGHKVVPPLKVQPTEGELKDIMRRSRLKGDGRITISQGLAELVAKGDMTLEDAVAEQAARHIRKRKGKNGKNGKSDG